MITKLFNFILITGAVHGFLFVLLPILMKKKIERPIWYLNAVVLFISLNNLQAWLIEKEFISPLFFVRNMEVPWYMLIVPSFYIFLIYYLRIEKNIKFFIRFILILFSAEIIIRSYLIGHSYFNQLDGNLIECYNNIEEVINVIISIFIFSKASMIVFKKNRHQEYLLLRSDLKWLRKFLILGMVIILLWTIAVILNLLLETLNQAYTYYPLRISSSLLIYYIGYQGFIRYNLLQDRISLRKELNNKKIDIGLSPTNASSEYNKLSDMFNDIDLHIIKNKRYLDPLFGLNDLAVEMKISSSQASKLINIYSNYNFSDYINKLRVEYVIKLLKDRQFNKYTMVALGLECGFNSKSAFYSAFKKFTEQTPTGYKKSHF